MYRYARSRQYEKKNHLFCFLDTKRILPFPMHDCTFRTNPRDTRHPTSSGFSVCHVIIVPTTYETTYIIIIFYWLLCVLWLLILSLSWSACRARVHCPSSRTLDDWRMYRAILKTYYYYLLRSKNDTEFLQSNSFPSEGLIILVIFKVLVNNNI